MADGTALVEKLRLSPAEVAIKELNTRRGFDWWWDSLEPDIRQEILAAVDARLAEAD